MRNITKQTKKITKITIPDREATAKITFKFAIEKLLESFSK